MRTIILLAFCIINSNLFAQKEQASYKMVMDQFTSNYNKGDHQAIFSMFSDEMKKNLPEDKTKNFLSSIKAQAGNISERSFIAYENNTYAVYKTTFERAVLRISVSVNKNAEINGLSIKPIQNEKSDTKVSNALSDKKGTMSQEQLDILYDHTKVFPNQTQLAIAFIKNGTVSYYGIKKEDNTVLHVENQKSIFEIGSITKVFTATLLANFVVDQKVQLNDAINKYLDLPVYDNIQIAFKELANHTSGLPRLPSNLDLNKVDASNPYKDYSNKDLEYYLKNSLEVPAGQKGKYEYSNLGSGLIGYVLSKIERVSFEQLLQDKIFAKYKMANSTTKKKKVKGVLINGMDPKGQKVSNWEFASLAGAGGILSNVEDLSKFALAQFDNNNKELKLTQQKTTSANENMDVGLGWHILTSKNNWIWHNGGTGGYSSSMTLDVKNKNGIVILSNVSSFSPKSSNIDKLCFALLQYFGKK